jgi:hypothetical protein
MGPSGSQTQRTEPPKYQLPYLQHGVQRARELLDAPGNRVAPMSDATTAGLHGIHNQALNNPITGAAGDLTTKTLQGGFLGSNPWLDQTFDRAALATQNQLASQFQRSGRNIDASQDLRSGQLNDLATQIYGGNYEAERNRQMQTLGMSPGLGQAQYSDFDRLLGVGQAREGYEQRNIDAPGNALDDYMARVSGNMGTTIKTSGGGNQAGGMLGGLLGLGGLLTGGLFGGF